MSTGKPRASSSHRDLTKTRSWDTPHTLLRSITAIAHPVTPFGVLGPGFPVPARSPHHSSWVFGVVGHGLDREATKVPCTPYPPPRGLQAGSCAISLGHIYLPLTNHRPVVSWLAVVSQAHQGGVCHIRPQLSPPHGSGRLHTCLPHFFCGLGSIFRVLSWVPRKSEVHPGPGANQLSLSVCGCGFCRTA